ncbi:GPO family capsid scaffolding protein [Serratia ficaria]|uniref:GPO family capsid scaffolding protein n=1 Tax=Serratia ficaria TaxID=61651 RepID=UPI00217C90F6|nr:GPO family capsid scaffolding protein [Serratia ficaria]CAI1149173.1 Phage capsid scaffolding protein (GPO) serine peptidase [Serratia ficaria]CAI2008180.1 Phage capsid scaffolding protein (GPO) serine peptidase [Serratia ficaria]CAI2518119.1 Phage capsid scaffolding protein (GPO) serine peptidase [Serratia ficaria]
MAKKVSKWFRIGVEGDTCDGRVIDGKDIQEMADSFDPRVYGCRINLEHFKGLFPNGDFKRLGDVVELKAEKIDDDSILNGKWALFAKMTPTDDLVAMVAAAQKVYTSMEIRPNFANTGKCYLVGLAVTDDPASLGTEYLEFCARAKTNPLAGRKDQPDDLFSAAVLVELEFEEQPEKLLSSLSERVKGMFSRKQASDDARFSDVHDAVTAVAEQVQANGDSAETRFSALEQEITGLKSQVEQGEQQLATLQRSLDSTENLTQKRRPAATGGDGDESLLTNC